MEKTLVQKRLFTLRQESKEVHVDWALIEKYLVKLNVNGKDEQEKISTLQTQLQVRMSNSISLVLFDTIFC